MKTILVLAPHPDVVDVVRSAVDIDSCRIVHRMDAEEAEPLLNAALLDVCVIDTEHAQVQGIWMIEKVRRRAPGCPILVLTGAKGWEWEEEAYVQGVRHVIAKPIRPRLLHALLERYVQAPPAAPEREPVASASFLPVAPAPPPPPPEPSATVGGTLSSLRDFSAILSNSLCAEALLKQFLLMLREILGVNRSAIFLRHPEGPFSEHRPSGEERLLHSACAIGLPPGLLEHFKLSAETGIGGHLFRHGRILRREGRDAAADSAVQKEFEILGVQVAVPVPDRESLVGIAVFDGRLTGEPLSNGELELVFHLLESLGLALRNIWLHQQLGANSEMMTDVLRQLSSGCVVVGRDLSILHANKAARLCFARSGRRHGEFEFSDVPSALGSKIYQVLKTGAGIAPFKYRPAEAPEHVFQVSIVPVQSQRTGLPGSALLIIEDHTKSEQLHQLELEAGNLRLVRQMADRLAHEVGNAMVPLSTHQQLFSRKFDDPEFRASLDTALADGVRRVTRLVNQMRFLARDRIGSRDRLAISSLIEEAYQEAQKFQPVKAAQLKYSIGEEPVVVEGDRPALRHALAEIMLNALQANPSSPRIAVEMQRETDRNGTAWVHLEFRDNGSGFTSEAVRRAPEPFFTTRNVGLGLGLVVTRKVAETHHGRLEIVKPRENAPAGIVRFSLPTGQPQEDSE